MEKALLEKISKSTKRSHSRSQVQCKNQESQTVGSHEDYDTRLTDIRREFDSRMTILQETVDDNLSRTAEKLKELEIEREELKRDLEVASKRCAFLKNLVYQPAAPKSRVLIVDEIKATHGWSRSGLGSLNLIAGLQDFETTFLTPPSSGNSLEYYLSVQ